MSETYKSVDEMLADLEHNEAQIQKGIELGRLDEKNHAPMYNPFHILRDAPALTEAIQSDAQLQQLKKSALGSQEPGSI